MSAAHTGSGQSLRRPLLSSRNGALRAVSGIFTDAVRLAIPDTACGGSGMTAASGSGEIDGEALEILKRYDLKCALVRCREHNLRGHAGLESLLPSRRAQAPSIPGL